MKIIIGHSNMDLDCFGSIALARYLHPDFIPVRSNLIHPVAKRMYNIYKDELKMIKSKELKNHNISEIVIVDTRSYRRVKEYFKHLKNFNGNITIYDHHPKDLSDIKNAKIIESDYASNTTHITLELKKKNIKISTDDATIALTGIFADSGNFTHENVSEADFEACAYLMKNGASIKLVKKFIKTLKQEHQISLFHDVLNRIVYRELQGNALLFSFLKLEKQVPGIAQVVEKIFEIEGADAYFAVFHIVKSKKTLIVARSSKKTLEINKVIKHFGGGGHAMAASAIIKNSKGEEEYIKLMDYLETNLIPAAIADEIMTKNVKTLKPDWNIKQASIYFEEIGHTGAPVVKNGIVIGFLSMRDIMKARKAQQINAPVKAYMSKKITKAYPDTSIREIEMILFSENIGKIPIINNKSEKLIGLITRTDYLKFLKKRDNEIEIVSQNIHSIPKNTESIFSKLRHI